MNENRRWVMSTLFFLFAARARLSLTQHSFLFESKLRDDEVFVSRLRAEIHVNLLIELCQSDDDD